MLGLTFKENVPDLRNSKVVDIIRELTKYGATVQVHDPGADHHEAHEEYGIKLMKQEDLLPAEAVVVAVPHRAYAEGSWKLINSLLRNNKGVVFDVRGVLPALDETRRRHSPQALSFRRGETMRPVLLLEINEVPWRLIDRFAGHEALPHLRRFFERSQTYSTNSTDTGELSPWVTWPTFHRGIPNTEHGVQFLGQDPATFKGTPIWEEYRNRGHSIGLCGSLQSWPPRDPGPGGFYIPDTFAKDERCIPAWVEPFQKFNLKQTGSNARVVNEGSLYEGDSLKFVLSLPRMGIRAATAASVAQQLVGERFDKSMLARRPTFQCILAWDIFRKLFDPTRPPAFSTFFTNHIAGIEHRYWDHIFPEDFGKPENGSYPHRETMLFGLKVLDQILEETMEFCEANPELLVVYAASMGQGPKVWKRYDGYVMTIPRVGELMLACNLTPADFEPLLAMVPQICVQIADPRKRQTTRELLENATPASGEKFFSIEENGDRLSISLVTPRKADIEAGSFRLGDRSLKWQDAGMQANSVETGTGYHIPEGSMAVYGRDIPPSDFRKSMLATGAKDFILSLAGVQGV